MSTPANRQEKPAYLAFISYRHADNKEIDRCWATWLHRALETYAIPPDLIGTPNLRGERIPARIYPVFRDEEEFAAEASLAPAIQNALERSRLLIVLCSPKSVQSPYVAEEIRHFKRLGRSDRIIPVLLDGEPGHPTREAFPEPLRIQLDPDGTMRVETVEPLAADFRLPDATEGYTNVAAYEKRLRSQSDASSAQREVLVAAYRERSQLAFLKIVAAVLAVPLGTLTRRDQAHQLTLARKRAKIFRSVAATLTILLVAAIITGIYANLKRAEAIKARDSANSLVGFMLTDLHDQLSETGRLDVLSSAVRKVDQHLASNPVPARLVADLRLQQARILFGQGRLPEAVDKARHTLTELPDDPSTVSRRAKLHAFLGDVLAWESRKSSDAKEECLKALGLFDSSSTDPATIEALVRTRIALGDIFRDDNEIPAALESYQSACDLAITATPELDPLRAQATLRNAEVCHLNNQGAAAAALVNAALELVQSHLALIPNSHPWLVVKAETLGLRSAIERYSGRISNSLASLEAAETCAEQTATPGQLHRIFLLASIRSQIAAHPCPSLTLPQREELFSTSIQMQRSLLREDRGNRSWAAKLASVLRDHSAFELELAELFKDPSFRKKALAGFREAEELLNPIDVPGTYRERVETLIALAGTDEPARKSVHISAARDQLRQMPPNQIETLLLEAMLDLVVIEGENGIRLAHEKILQAWHKSSGIRRNALTIQLAESHMRLASLALSASDAVAFRAESDRAIACLGSLVPEGSDQPDLEEKLALALSRHARGLQTLGHTEESELAYQRSAGIFRTITNRYPSHAAPFREISLAEYQLGKIASTKGNSKLALELLQSSFGSYLLFVRNASLEVPRPPSPLSVANLSTLRAITARQAEAAAELDNQDNVAAAWGSLFHIAEEVDSATLAETDRKALIDVSHQSLAGAIDALSKISRLTPDQSALARVLITAAENPEDRVAPPAGLEILKKHLSNISVSR